MGAAECVLRSGKILTVDSDFSTSDAIAIAGNRILAVGTNEAIEQHIAPDTRVYDLNGRTVVPGLIDGHAHMDREGLKGVYPSLAGYHSIQDIQARISEIAQQAKPGDWIITMPIGDPPYYFDMPEGLAEKRWPSRQELDAAAPLNPVFIRSIWGFWRHILPLVSCANTEALRRAGIDGATVPPLDTIEITKDASGDPTGIILEWDYQPVVELTWFRQAGGFTHADRVLGIPIAASAYLSYGTTSIFEEHGVANELLRAYQQAHDENRLKVRSALVFSPNWKALAAAPLGPFIEAWAGGLGQPGLGDDWLKVGGLHVGTGPSLANELRATAAPYTGWAGFNYDAHLPRDKAKEILIHCAKNDIGAVGISNLSPGLLELFEEVDRDIPLKGRRWVLGHISTLAPREIDSIARMELVVTPHTNRYIYKESHLLQDKLPSDRHREITPLRDLLSSGVRVGLATDNVPVSMFWPVWESVARYSRATGERVAPEQALSREEAIRCATINGAYLTFDEGKKGSLEPGKLADLAVLSKDPLTVAEEEIRDITATMTMVGGEIVHEDGLERWCT
jgi:predicted amidohydrolase YtcJ